MQPCTHPRACRWGCGLRGTALTHLALRLRFSGSGFRTAGHAEPRERMCRLWRRQRALRALPRRCAVHAFLWRRRRPGSRHAARGRPPAVRRGGMAGVAAPAAGARLAFPGGCRPALCAARSVRAPKSAGRACKNPPQPGQCHAQPRAPRRAARADWRFAGSIRGRTRGGDERRRAQAGCDCCCGDPMCDCRMRSGWLPAGGWGLRRAPPLLAETAAAAAAAAMAAARIARARAAAGGWRGRWRQWWAC